MTFVKYEKIIVKYSEKQMIKKNFDTQLFKKTQHVLLAGAIEYANCTSSDGYKRV